MLKIKCSPLKIGKKAKMSPLTILIEDNAESYSHCNKAREGNKSHIEQKENKTVSVYR